MSPIAPIGSIPCEVGGSHSLLELAEWMNRRARLLGVTDDTERTAFVIGQTFMELLITPGAMQTISLIVDAAVAWQNSLRGRVPMDDEALVAMTFPEWVHGGRE